MTVSLFLKFVYSEHNNLLYEMNNGHQLVVVVFLVVVLSLN